jgi:hypothetical protein
VDIGDISCRHPLFNVTPHLNEIINMTTHQSPPTSLRVASIAFCTMSFMMSAAALAAPPQLLATDDEVKFVLTPDTGNAQTNDTLTVDNSMTLQFSCKKRTIGSLKLVIPRDGYAQAFHESSIGIASFKFALDGGTAVYVAAATTNNVHTATIPSPQATLSIWFNHDKLSVQYDLQTAKGKVARTAAYDLKSMRALKNGVRQTCWSLPI